MRFHIFGLPHTKTNNDYTACAYTAKVLKFGKMMTERGHTVIHYGHPDSDLICTEHVDVIDRATYDRVYGDHDFHSKFFKYDMGDDAYQEFFRRAIEEVGKRKQKNDFILEQAKSWLGLANAYWKLDESSMSLKAAEKAKSIFSQLGAKLDLNRTENLIETIASQR